MNTKKTSTCDTLDADRNAALAALDAAATGVVRAARTTSTPRMKAVAPTKAPPVVDPEDPTVPMRAAR